MTIQTPSKSALVLFSGGQDSATCLAWALERYERVETVGFEYGQRHVVEMQAREDVRAGIGEMPRGDRLGEDFVVDLAGYGAIAESALTAERAIEMQANGLPSTFVPGRNLVFLTVASALAYRRGHGVLVGGMCETDYSGYPDCRRATIDAMQGALALGLDTPMVVETPLMQLDKGQTWALAAELGGDALVELIRTQSHTCYRGERGMLHDWGHGCGTCPACELRAAGWRAWQERTPA
ncbi:MAG: 7-cyano-7-deazaguanine synthase QueC [Pseudomonadota bacterium]|nr:7-cyano-7-deazaguanine synthase QueC [Pseudomonadota bacterium]